MTTGETEGDWYWSEGLEAWWYVPDTSDMLIRFMAGEGYVIHKGYTNYHSGVYKQLGPFDTLEAAQAAYLVLLEG